MKTAGIAELKKRLSEYLAAVKAGGEVLVTERGRPIARIVPERRRQGPREEDLHRLEREGLIRRGSRELEAGFLREKLPRSRRSVLEALLDERSENR